MDAAEHIRKDRLNVSAPREQVEYQIVLGYPDGTMKQGMPGATFSAHGDAENAGMPVFKGDQKANEMFICTIRSAFKKTVIQTL